MNNFRRNKENVRVGLGISSTLYSNPFSSRSQTKDTYWKGFSFNMCIHVSRSHARSFVSLSANGALIRSESVNIAITICSM